MSTAVSHFHIVIVAVCWYTYTHSLPSLPCFSCMLVYLYTLSPLPPLLQLYVGIPIHTLSPPSPASAVCWYTYTHSLPSLPCFSCMLVYLYTLSPLPPLLQLYVGIPIHTLSPPSPASAYNWHVLELQSSRKDIAHYRHKQYVHAS